jgi:hypothetical protein
MSDIFGRTLEKLVADIHNITRISAVVPNGRLSTVLPAVIACRRPGIGSNQLVLEGGFRE